jgi:hypothetical protein
MNGPRLHAKSRALAGAALLIAASSALADETTPSVQDIRSAAAEYDAGRRAFVEKDYDGAAAHFENAFHDAPSAEALRNAIRARRRAGQLARAATLAEVASARYPKDAPTTVVVRETLAESASKLHKITLSCSPECGVAADGRAISLTDATQTLFFLEPGTHDLLVSWSNDRTKAQKFVARAGGRDELTLEAPPLPPPPPVAVAPVPGGVTGVVTPNGAQVDQLADRHTKPLGPAAFITLAAITAGGVGFTIWSGINAENDPGPNAVKTECVGKGPNCPAYQSGLSAQLRTNVAIGVTGGVALATAVVGIFFTRWTSPKPRPNVGGLPFTLEPEGGLAPGGAVLGLKGRF